MVAAQGDKFDVSPLGFTARVLSLNGTHARVALCRYGDVTAEVDCQDGRDNDCNGLIDAADPACAGRIPPAPPAVCVVDGVCQAPGCAAGCEECVRGKAPCGPTQVLLVTCGAVTPHAASGKRGRVCCCWCVHRETYLSCPLDCPALCGDGACTGAETAAACPQDCPPVCGDCFCDAARDETALSCPQDCPPVCGDGFCE